MSKPVAQFDQRPPLFLFTSEEWEELFPPEVKTSRHALKYFLAVENEVPPSYLTQLKNARSPQLNSPFGEERITALHIATMKNLREMVSRLLDAGADPNIPDAYGWTPLHHAALVSQQISDMLIGKGADPTLTTNKGATFQDLKGLTGRERVIDRRKILYEEDKAACEITSEQLERLSGLRQYTDECIYTETFLVSLWTSDPETYDRTVNFHPAWQKRLHLLYQIMRKNPPTVILKRFGKELGLLAGEPLKCGQGIVEYTGKSVPKSEIIASNSFKESLRIFLKNEYRLEELDARNFGNVSRFINDGWPNVASCKLLNEKGLLVRSVFFVSKAEGVQNHEELLWDYGSGHMPLKWGHYLIKNKKGAREFFSQKSISDYLKGTDKDIEAKDLTIPTVVALFQFEQCLCHPLTTPAVLIDLTCSQIVKPEDWDLLLKNPMAEQRLSYPPHRAWVETTLSILKTFERNLHKLNTLSRETLTSQKIRQFFLDSEDRLSVLQLIRGFTCVNHAFETLFQDMTKLPIFWENLQHELQGLSTYHWENDPKFPFPLDWTHLFEDQSD